MNLNTSKLQLILLVVTGYCESANILCVLPLASKSHYIMLRPIGLELARRGHNVSVITAYNEIDHPPNYHQFMVEEKSVWDAVGLKRPNSFTLRDLSAEEYYTNVLWRIGLAYTEAALNSTPVQELLAEDLNFDLVISEQFFQEATNVLAYKYQASLILVTTFGNCMRHNIAVRNPLQLATVLSEFLDVRNPTSFWGRLRNFYFTVYEFVWWKYWYLDKHEQLVKKYILNIPEPVPNLYDIQKNASFILVNSHFSFDPPTAYLPNIVEIGGLHLTKSDSQLPEDLQSILDNAIHGVVYMNLGSNVQSSELPGDKKRAFLNVFRRLKHTVLWKWEDDNLEDIPENLIIRKWLPQKEILAHPNITVFISHGGLIGTQEAIFNGVSIIGIPIYADQYNNLLQVQNMGFGKILEYHQIDVINLESILHEVLDNDSYVNKAKEVSVRFKDRPLDPLDTAMFWIEYVIRNKGADFIKNPARELSWIAYNMFDVYVFISIIGLIFLFIVYKALTILKRHFGAGEAVTNDKKKRQ